MWQLGHFICTYLTYLPGMLSCSTFWYIGLQEYIKPVSFFHSYLSLRCNSNIRNMCHVIKIQWKVRLYNCPIYLGYVSIYHNIIFMHCIIISNSVNICFKSRDHLMHLQRFVMFPIGPSRRLMTWKDKKLMQETASIQGGKSSHITKEHYILEILELK